MPAKIAKQTAKRAVRPRVRAKQVAAAPKPKARNTKRSTTPKTASPLAPTVWTNWSVAQVRTALELHEMGDFSLSAILADHLRRDDRIFSALDSRVLGILGLAFAMLPPEESANDNAKAKTLAAESGRWWWKAFPEAVAADVERWVQVMGFAVGEATWAANSNAERLQPTVHVHDLQFVSWNDTLECFELQTREGKVQITPGDGRWLLFAPVGVARPWMNGAIRALAIPFLIRTFTRRDWSRRSEIEGIGVKKAKIPDTSRPHIVDKFLRDVQRLGAESTIRLPPGFDLDLMVVDTQSSNNFERLLAHCDTAITLVLLGQNMTTQIEGGGSYAAASVHVLVLRARMAADVATLSTVLREQLLMPWGRLNEADWDDELAPWPTWDTKLPEDLQAKAQGLLTAAQAIEKIKALGIDITPVLELMGLKALDDDNAKLPEIRAYHLQAGIVTANEVRKRLKLEERDDGNVLLTPKESNANEAAAAA